MEVEFRHNALAEIAKKAIARKSGARGLRSIMEHSLLELMYEVPSMNGLHKVVVDENVIKNGTKPIFVYENEAAKAVSE